MIHPLDTEDILVSVQELVVGATSSYVALARHLPTNLLGQGHAATAAEALEAAKDDLLKLLEEAGGG